MKRSKYPSTAAASRRPAGVFGRRLVRPALVPPVRTNRLGRDLYPPAEIAGLDTGRLIPRHADRRQETEPAQQRHRVGPLGGLRQPASLKITQIRGDRRDYPTAAIKQPLRFERVTALLKATVRRHHQRTEIPGRLVGFDHEP